MDAGPESELDLIMAQLEDLETVFRLHCPMPDAISAIADSLKLAETCDGEHIRNLN